MIDDWYLKNINQLMENYRKMEPLIRAAEAYRPYLEMADNAASIRNRLQDSLRSKLEQIEREKLEYYQTLTQKFDATNRFLSVYESNWSQIANSRRMPVLQSTVSQIAQLQKVLGQVAVNNEILSSLQNANVTADLFNRIETWRRVVSIPRSMANLSQTLERAEEISQLLIRIDDDAFSEIETDEEFQEAAEIVSEEFIEALSQTTLEATLLQVQDRLTRLETQHRTNLLWKKILKGIGTVVMAVAVDVAGGMIKDSLFPKATDREIRKYTKEIATEILKSEQNQDSSAAITMLRVAATTLNVRKAPTRKAQRIGRLYMGDCVTVSDKSGSWTRVTFYDREAKAAISGWVFSRYLIRLN